jgi:hypothetical protein
VLLLNLNTRFKPRARTNNQMNTTIIPRPLRIYSIIGLGLLSAAATIHAQSDPDPRQAQSWPVKLGTSGGNIDDRSRLYCCSGTLGALVKGTDGT